MEKIAILTSGGDSQGMNAYLYKITNLLIENNFEPIGIFNGYNGIFEENFVNLTKNIVENISFLGGSFLKTARSERFATEEGVKKASEILKSHDIKNIIINGGNGSFKGANELSKHNINVICIPGTIDNDLFYSDISLGFDTAVNNAVEVIDKVKQTMQTNNRGLIAEVMGRHCGNIALNVAVSVNANSLILNEDEDSKKNVFSRVEKAIKNGCESPVIVLQENILDGNNLAIELSKKFNKTFKFEVIGYVQRGGSPTIKDRIFANLLAFKTLELLKTKTYNQAIGMNKENVFNMPLDKALNVNNNFNSDLYELYLSSL